MKPHEVAVHTKTLPFMTMPQAELVYRLIAENGCTRGLELGTHHGASACYIAGALQDVSPEDAHLVTIDQPPSEKLNPNVESLVLSCGLSHMVTVKRHSCFTWELMHMLGEDPRPEFDFVYIDGGHMWKEDGFAFFLAEKLLRVGGVMLFDDLHRKRFDRAVLLRDKDPRLIEEFIRRINSGEPGEREFLLEKLIYRVWTHLVKEHPNMGDFVEYDGRQLLNRWGMASARKIQEAK